MCITLFLKGCIGAVTILCIGILPTIVTTGKCHLVLKYYGYHRSFTTDLVVISHAGKGLLGFKLKNCVVCTVTALYYT